MNLTYSPWKIEQLEFSADDEPQLEKQLAISNGYISQNACFEEYYSGPTESFTYLRGMSSPLPSGAMFSVRLGEERLDLATWHIRSFYRCLFRQEPRLERRFTATSPSGCTISVECRRALLPQSPQLVQMEYLLTSVDYDGPISLLSFLGHPSPIDDWYPLAQEVTPDHVGFWLQCRAENVRVAAAMSFSLQKNGQPVEHPFIRVEKHYIAGFSTTEHIAPGDTFLLRRTMAISDSRNYPSNNLLADTIALL